jgi:hypothetical protein
VPTLAVRVRRRRQAPVPLRLTHNPGRSTWHLVHLTRSCWGRRAIVQQIGTLQTRRGPSATALGDRVKKPSHERKTRRRRPMHGGRMNLNPAVNTRRGAFPSHQFEARILRHPMSSGRSSSAAHAAQHRDAPLLEASRPFTGRVTERH